MKIVNSRKFIRSLFFLIGLVLVISMFISNVSFSNKELSYKEIYASSGDTLWSLAKEESKNNIYYSDKDLRYIVKDIKKINDLENSELSIGQKLIIPSL